MTKLYANLIGQNAFLCNSFLLLWSAFSWNFDSYLSADVSQRLSPGELLGSERQVVCTPSLILTANTRPQMIFCSPNSEIPFGWKQFIIRYCPNTFAEGNEPASAVTTSRVKWPSGEVRAFTHLKRNFRFKRIYVRELKSKPASLERAIGGWSEESLGFVRCSHMAKGI